MKLCCIFNYPSYYRECIYKKIDETFDTQFMWGEAVEDGKPCDIKKLDYSILRRRPLINKNKMLLGRYPWVTGLMTMPFRPYDTYMLTELGWNSGLPFMLLCRLMGKRVYGWGHGDRHVKASNKWLFRLKYQLVTGFFCYGERGRQRLIELGVPAEKLHVIYNSLGERFDPEERRVCQSDILRTHFGNDLPTLLFVGRLTAVKQLDWLIRAMQQHDAQGVKYNLLLIGDGSEGAKLRQLAAASGLQERIWFYGECYDESQLNVLIYNADLCVSPGNVGLTALHAMMYGTPVLSHDDFETQMPEYETIIPGQTGMLYRHGSFDDFCRQITLWLTTQRDRDEVRRHCYDLINGKWNADYQLQLFQTVLGVSTHN